LQWEEWAKGTTDITQTPPKPEALDGMVVVDLN
jgi:hypothetical protein